MTVSPELVADECFMNAAVMSSMAGVHLKQGGPFGASIVRNGVLISCAHNTFFSDQDPTCHGEMNAIRLAMRCLGTSDLSDCVIYSSFDPCPMCWGAILNSGIKKVYMGLDRYEAAKGGVDYLSFYDALLNPKNNSMIKVNPSATVADSNVMKMLNNSPEHCIIVDKDYNVIADSNTQTIGLFSDPVDTPMVKAIRMACHFIGSPYLNGCKIFTRMEPDVESYAACLWAFADSLYYSNDAPEGTRARYQHEQYQLEESQRDLQVVHNCSINTCLKAISVWHDSELLKEHPQLKAC